MKGRLNSGDPNTELRKEDEITFASCIFGILGPLVAAFGAGFLAYGALHGLPMWDVLVGNPRKFKKSVMRIYESRLADKKIEANEEEIERLDLEERQKTQSLALRGLVLIAVGSIFQAASVFLRCL